MKNLFLLIALAFTSQVFSQINKASDDLFTVSARDNKGKSGETITKESLHNYDKFIAIDMNNRVNSVWADKDWNKPKVLTKENAEIALREAMNNPVVSLHQYNKYDPYNKGIGFCFGRAMFVNLYLAINGFNRANIKKAFIVGPMSRGEWAWHVTTIVESRNKAGKEIWLAIDPVVGQVLEVKAWYKYWQGSSDDGKLRLYIAEAGKFGAASSWYDENSISDKFYNNYFVDMRKWFEKNDISGHLKF